MPSYISSELVSLSGDSTTLTIPASTEGVVVCSVAGTTTDTEAYSAITLNSASPDTEVNLSHGEINSGAWAGFLAYWHNPSTGSQTLAATEPNLFDRSTIVIYLDDCGATADDSDGDHHQTGAASITLTGMSGFAVRFEAAYDTDPSTPTGYTSAALDSPGQTRMRASYRSDASSSEVMTTGANDQSVVFGIGIPAAAAAGPVIPVETHGKIRKYRQLKAS